MNEVQSVQTRARNPMAVAALAFVVGLLVGWIVLGWWLFPVKWTDAAPVHLHPDYQMEFLRMAVEAYQYDQNEELARFRFAQLGSAGPQLLAKLRQNPDPLPAEAVEAFAQVVQAQPAQPGQQQPAQGGGGPGFFTVILLLCMLVIIALVVVGVFVAMRRKRQATTRSRERKEAVMEAMREMRPGEEPLAHYVTTYEFGNDFFDESFSIETQAGEFLGEAGIALSETINTGQPKEVAALEAWLFDKNDMQTITKVLVLPDAPQDLMNRVSNKGDVVPVQPGAEVQLESTNLRALVRIRDMEVEEGPNGRYFKFLSLEFLVWGKVGGGPEPEPPLAV